MTVLTLGRFAPWLAVWLSPLVALLMVATVYGRYHYVVDVLAGIVVAVLAHVTATRLERRQSPPVNP